MKLKNFIIIFLLTATIWQLSFFSNLKAFAQTETPTSSPPSSTITTPTISITSAPNPTTTTAPSTTPSANNTPTSTPISLTPTIIKKATIIIKKPTATITPEPTVTTQPSITPTPTTIGFMEKLSGRTLTFFFILSGLLLMGISYMLYRKRG